MEVDTEEFQKSILKEVGEHFKEGQPVKQEDVAKQMAKMLKKLVSGGKAGKDKGKTQLIKSRTSASHRQVFGNLAAKKKWQRNSYFTCLTIFLNLLFPTRAWTSGRDTWQKNRVSTTMGAPCQELLLGNDTENVLSKRPSLKAQLKKKWNAIPAARLSGLAPTFHGGSIDLCDVNGVWSPTLQAAHQGAIPIMASLTGSRGIVKPYVHGTLSPQEAKVEHSAFGRLETVDKKLLTNITDGRGNWREMDWNSNRRRIEKEVQHDNPQ